MDTSPPSIEPGQRAARTPPPRARRLAALLLTCAGLVASARPARANVRAPLVEPRRPSSAALPPDGAVDVSVLGERLIFRCAAGACEVEARYRLLAREPVALELAFILPSATPVAVRVGSVAAPVTVTAAPPAAVRDDEVEALERRALDLQHLPVLQAKFPAQLVAGENALVVTYRQPLGRHEYGHGYFSQGRFLEFFRYELWPLSEWKRAADFRIEGEVSIHRPPPSWWKRTFSTPRSLGCRGSEPLQQAALEQQGDDLRFVFQITHPIPRRLWCEIGDQDLVAQP
jgi:hypothetical protein